MLPMGYAETGDNARSVDFAVLNKSATDKTIRAIARNELLFEAGDIKTKIYRVEAGAVTVYRTRPDLTIEIIEHALAGDLVGMGFLERHAASARASVETRVRCFDLDQVDELIENDPHNKSRFDDAQQREFLFRRETLTSVARERPQVRLAAFLVAVAHRTAEEGGDPTLIDDSVDCGVIADFLGLSVDLLALALMQLEMLGLVEAAPPHGLRLKNIPGLEAIASEHDNVPDWSPAGNESRLAVQ